MEHYKRVTCPIESYVTATWGVLNRSNRNKPSNLAKQLVSYKWALYQLPLGTNLDYASSRNP